jgi:hypothetical protein
MADELTLQPKTPTGKDTLPVTSQAFNVRVRIDLDAFYTRLENESLRLLNELGQQGLEGAELADRVVAGLNSLPDAPIERMGRASTAEAFNLGRNLAAQDNLTKIREAVRTEVLDENTCTPCRLLDGTRVLPNTDEYFELMPPRLCDGKEFCRGFYLYRYRSN